jgi:hypothetical protein
MRSRNIPRQLTKTDYASRLGIDARTLVNLVDSGLITPVAELVVAGPLGKLDLADQHLLNPHTPFHNRRRDPLAPPRPHPFSGKLTKGQVARLIFCMPSTDTPRLFRRSRRRLCRRKEGRSDSSDRVASRTKLTNSKKYSTAFPLTHLRQFEKLGCWR